MTENVNRLFLHYAPVSKHKEMRTSLGWTFSYKSLYFVHPSLDLVPLFTGTKEGLLYWWFILSQFQRPPKEHYSN